MSDVYTAVIPSEHKVSFGVDVLRLQQGLHIAVRAEADERSLHTAQTMLVK